MPLAATLPPIKFRPVPRLLDHIGLAMYSNFNKAIAELVVNGYDADATEVAVEITAHQIVIRDNGTGMSEDDIRNSYMMLGSDQKRNVKRTPRFNRLPIGNKGIGKLAGLGIARRISVTTIKGARSLRYEIDRDELEKSKTIEDSRHELLVIDEDAKESGTVIVLSKIMPHVRIDAPQLRGYLAREIPQERNFHITVNGEKCLRKDIPAKRRIPVHLVDPVCGSVTGEVVVAKKVLTNIQPGILTTVRGRVVGEPSLFDLNSGPHKYHYGFLLTGQVEVPGFDPENEVDLIPVIATDREGFNRNHPKYRAYHKLITDLLIKVCREEEKEAESKRQKDVEAKVQEAIKRVADDFNAFSKVKKQEQETTRTDAPTAQPSDVGTKKVSVKTEQEFHETSPPDEKHRTNPVGITDKRLRQELDALPGIGHIHLGPKRYKITMKPLGVDDFECRIDDEKLIINVNVSHPAYEQAVEEKCVEITVFRAIGSAFAWKESATSEEMYQVLDELIRFQAFRLATRRLRKRSV
jgi:histidine kinase/DNA gyrase B/HSP90-like ATPase